MMNGTVMTRDMMKRLVDKGWRDWFSVERVEFPTLKAVHFVIYGLAWRRGVRINNEIAEAKSFADFIRYPTVLWDKFLAGRYE
jgi:hypothetical protein